MNRYDPKTPRATLVISAAAMTLLTISLFVVAPAAFESDTLGPRPGCGNGSDACSLGCSRQSPPVLGEREQTVAVAMSSE